jgi:hypothetical protein
LFVLDAWAWGLRRTVRERPCQACVERIQVRLRAGDRRLAFRVAIRARILTRLQAAWEER